MAETDSPVLDVLSVPRHHALDDDPHPETIWRYTPTDAKRLAGDVMRVCGNDSFVSRVLLVITRNGSSKNFEEITGEDGLTFGITDFAGNSGCHGFFTSAAKHVPEAFASAFGDEGEQLLDLDWITKNNGGGHGEASNNAGLIRFRWVRRGLAQLLGDPRLRGFQLAQFVRGKVNPALAAHQAAGFQTDFMLAAMVGIANSFGAGGMKQDFLVPATKQTTGTGLDREYSIVKWMLRQYTCHETDQDGTADLLACGLGEKTGDLPSEDCLGHRGRRALALFEIFPFAQCRPFDGLGTFALQDEERFAEEPTTA